MPRNQSEQNGFVMDQNTQKLIGDAQAAFEILKNISGKFQTVANLSQFTGNEEDDEFIAEIANLDFFEEDDEEDFDDEENVAGASYYGRGMNQEDFGFEDDGGYGSNYRRGRGRDQEDFGFDNNYGHGGNCGRGRGRGRGCGCGCQCQHKSPEIYPCQCRECDKLKAKAYTNLVLGINDLKDAFTLLCLAKDKFDDAIDSIQDAKKLFEKARFCSIRFGCKCYCKTRRKGHCRHCR